ncbi:hypothetical protein GFS31_19810 [Leptolyngbya sp. BL0902]|uniref:hypothetical protein n=1 Tax=Leptolyngbya sp. BL0902 TaxID=1115757 RepID=UPI0018E88F61|nr:hypothetical protein [Leptolyngbya sp. BL0902]QQE65295.1 hypothetical protein GFS31_19810 [Leptolyngbya sp. BL0902]
MTYTFRYLNPSEFSQRNEELAATNNIIISADNAKEIGVICLRAIQVYEEIQRNYRQEKTSLKLWVRDQRASVRNHGRVFRYKGVSRTRSNLNASISNANDSVLNKIDIMIEASRSNNEIAKVRLAECLTFVKMADIKRYESIYLESKSQRKNYESLKSTKQLFWVSIWLSPIVIGIAINSVLPSLLAILLLTPILASAWVYFSLSQIKRIQKETERFENAEKSAKLLKESKKQEKEEEESFLNLVNEGSKAQLDQAQVAAAAEIQNAEANLNRELAKHLKENYVTFEHACLSLDIDANDWMDLAEKVNSNREDNENENLFPDSSGESITDQLDDKNSDDIKIYTEESLKLEFSSFKEAKDFFGVSANSWASLARKLNNRGKN